MRRWREARRDRRWIAERGARFTEAEALIVSYTKSGRTWVRVMLSHLLHQQFGIPETELIDGTNFKQFDPRAPIIQFSPDIVFPPPEFGPPIHHLRADQKIVFLLRDPRDVVVSFYHHVTKRAGVEELRRKRIPAEARAQDLDSFVLEPWVGVERIIKRLNGWAEVMGSDTQSLVVRYEDLRENAEQGLQTIAAFLELPASPHEIEKAAAFAQFDTMKAREREGYFRTKRLGVGDADDPDSAKVRQGKIGGYREVLREATIRELDTVIATKLDARIGYGGTA